MRCEELSMMDYVEGADFCFTDGKLVWLDSGHFLFSEKFTPAFPGQAFLIGQTEARKTKVYSILLCLQSF